MCLGGVQVRNLKTNGKPVRILIFIRYSRRSKSEQRNLPDLNIESTDVRAVSDPQVKMHLPIKLISGHSDVESGRLRDFRPQ